jgi:hypothetical protein
MATQSNRLIGWTGASHPEFVRRFGSDRKYSDFSPNAAVRASQCGAASGGPSVPEETYHMTAAVETTSYDFAKTILEEAARAPREVSWFVEASC